MFSKMARDPLALLLCRTNLWIGAYYYTVWFSVLLFPNASHAPVSFTERLLTDLTSGPTPMVTIGLLLCLGVVLSKPSVTP